MPCSTTSKEWLHSRGVDMRAIYILPIPFEIEPCTGINTNIADYFNTRVKTNLT